MRGESFGVRRKLELYGRTWTYFPLPAIFLVDFSSLRLFFQRVMTFLEILFSLDALANTSFILNLKFQSENQNVGVSPVSYQKTKSIRVVRYF